MKKHNGMRPLDIAVLFKIISFKERRWYQVDLSRTLFISQSEISESLTRNKVARLLSPDGKTVLRKSFYEFLVYGLKYVFPVSPGNLVRGIPTAHSAKPISDFIINLDEIYVWACDDGELRGQSIQPLYKNAAKAVKEDFYLYELLALTDIIRTGNTREFNIAVEELAKMVLK
jgi:hypothetical protein